MYERWSVTIASTAPVVCLSRSCRFIKWTQRWIPCELEAECKWSRWRMLHKGRNLLKKELFCELFIEYFVMAVVICSSSNCLTQTTLQVLRQSANLWQFRPPLRTVQIYFICFCISIYLSLEQAYYGLDRRGLIPSRGRNVSFYHWAQDCLKSPASVLTNECRRPLG